MHVVLVNPEIPPNTGNVARLCVGAGVRLHLVRPLGFSLDDRYLRRAGLDYWPHLDLTVHDDLDSLLAARGRDPMFLASTGAARPYTEAAYTEDAWLVFGRETTGLPDELLARHPGDGVRIPMWGATRSVNLSNAVAVVLYEALRQVRPASFYPGVARAAGAGP